MQNIPIVQVEFCDTLGFDPIPRLGAYTIADALRGIQSMYPSWQSKVLQMFNEQYVFKIEVNGEFICQDLDDLRVLVPYRENKIKITALPVAAGDDLLSVGAGIGLLVAGLSGVGILGLSATSIPLMGASLVFTTLFKHPKNDDETDATKRSVNFSGVINTTGSGQVLALAFGRDVVIGSIVASAQIVPYDAAVE